MFGRLNSYCGRKVLTTWPNVLTMMHAAAMMQVRVACTLKQVCKDLCTTLAAARAVWCPIRASLGARCAEHRHGATSRPLESCLDCRATVGFCTDVFLWETNLDYYSIRIATVLS